MILAADSKSLTYLTRNFVRDLAAYGGGRLPGVAAFIVFGAVLEWFGLATLVPLLSIVTKTDGAATGNLNKLSNAVFVWMGIDDPNSRLAALLFVFALLVILRIWVISKRDINVADLQIGFIESLRLRLVGQLAAAPWERVLRLSHTRVTHLLSSDIQNASIAADVLLRVAFALSMLLAQAALLLLLSPALALCVLFVMALIPIAFLPMLRRAHQVGMFESNASASLLDTASHFLGGLKLAISQNLQPAFIREFRDTLGHLRERQIAFQRQQTRSRLTHVSMSAFVGALFVFVGFAFFHTPAPTLIVFLVVISRMAPPIIQLQESFERLARLLPGYGNIKALEAELGSAVARAVALGGNGRIDGTIVLESVSYVHGQQDAGGVRGLDLRIEQGQFIGVTGPSGSGKTTFADLLVGLLPAQEGRVTVGRTVVDESVLAAWREQVAYVSQDVFLFHDSVRRNLVWSSPEADEAKLWDALSLVGAADLVRRMEHGLDTVLGERGSIISGGERQRLAIARAILRQPRLLVLDEATSAIDVEGERIILERLHTLRPRPTIILIAHRAESLQLCDRVLRFEHGRAAFEPALVPRPAEIR